MRIVGEPPTKRQALAAMLGTGVALEIVMPAGEEAFLKQSRALLLPPIREPGFRRYPFYIPIVEPGAMEPASSKQLDRWFCGASAYIRESVEDKGILIASREPLAPILEQLGGRMEMGPEPSWRIPL
jgi:hypothetical protein